MDKFISCFLLLALFLISACEEDNSDDMNALPQICDRIIQSNEAIFTDITTDAVQITNAVITDDCLELEISASGCDGSTWEVELVDSGAVDESSPPQRDLKLSLINVEECDAVITLSFTFDLRNLRIPDDPVRQVILNLQDWNSPLTYNY